MDPADVRYEEEVSKNPYSLSAWLVYIRSKDAAPAKIRYMLYERALRRLPRSYKLWHAYLRERTLAVRGKVITDRRYASLAATFERSLVHMHKMPRIWIMFINHLIQWRRGTLTRHTFDRAIRALPLSQHGRIWELYVPWAKDFGVPETTILILRRYLQYDPSQREIMVDYLESISAHEEAIRQTTECLNIDESDAVSSTSSYKLWIRLCAMCATHAEQAANVVDVEAVIKSGIQRFSSDVGKLWVHLANFYTRLGRFERARDVYEEAIASVRTLRDFAQIFDGYVKFEEALLTNKMSSVEAPDEEEDIKALESEVALIEARLHHLLDRRPVLVTDVKLRQNPNNATEWYKKATLMGTEHNGDGEKRPSALVLLQALATVAPFEATGRLSRLWLALGWMLDAGGDPSSCRLAFQTATEVSYKTAEEAGAVWCAWAEWEIAKGDTKRALSVMQRAVQPPKLSSERRSEALRAAGSDTQARRHAGELVHKSVRVWNLYLDLEETIGTVDTVRAAYDQAFTLKVLTPTMAINFARYLTTNQYFEEAFKCFERAIELFKGKFPHCKPLWIAYLKSFNARYGGDKIERLRNLYEQSLGQCPLEDKAYFYLEFALLEERHGLARHCVRILEQGAGDCDPVHQADLYRVCIKKTEKHFGLSATRPVYERAVAVLSRDDARALCENFAAMETALGEVDRARAIYTHASQHADPRYQPQFWVVWRDFEESHGNEDTFREMLRIRRSVDAAKVGSHVVAEDLRRGFMVPARTKAGGAERAMGSGALKRGFVSGGVKGGNDEAPVEPNTKRQAGEDQALGALDRFKGKTGAL